MSRCPVVTVSSVVYRCDAPKCRASFRADVPGSKRDYPTVAYRHADDVAHRAGWFLVNGEQATDCRCPEHRAVSA